MAKLYRVILPVTDIATAQRFYSLILGQNGKRVSPGRHYFDCGGMILACLDPRADGEKREAKRNREHIYFAVNKLEDIFRRASFAGCKWIEPAIKKRPWGERSFYAQDPFGNPICFVDESTIFTG
jgi:uncharacterized glyoxalase superfamily protein PhnB